jgi:hypothetical protein
MPKRIYIFGQPGSGPQGPDLLGVAFRLLSLAGMVMLGVFVLLPLLGIALGIGLGIVAIGAIVVGYFRLRAWVQSKLSHRHEEPPHQAGASYKAEVLDDNHNEGDQDNRPRRTVEVHRRPHRD